MIDKVNGNGVYGYESKNNKKNPAVKAYEDTPGTKEAALKRAGRTHSASTDMAGKDRQGVILDLSPKAAREKSRAALLKKSAPWTDALRRLFAPVIRWLRDFWESDASHAESAGEGGKQPEGGAGPEDGQGLAEAAAGMPFEILESGPDDDMGELPPLDEVSELADFAPAAGKALKHASLRQLEEMLTQNGTKHLAHNSDLLTYYDRRGKLVEMDDSERHRVLFGDKNVLKL